MSVKDNIKISELEEGVTKTLTISPEFVKDLCNGNSYGCYGLYKTLNAMNDMTLVTDREVGLDIYCPFRKNPGRKKGPTHILNVPVLGDQTSVSKPSLTGKELQRGSTLEYEMSSLFVPIIHIHTHPATDASPSQDDYEAIDNRMNQEYEFQGNSFNVNHQLFEVIAARENNFLFWRSNLNLNAYNEYLSVLSKDGEFMPLTEKVRLMNETGAFTAHYFNGSRYRKFKKDNLLEISELFTPFEIEVTKIKR